MGLSSAQTSGYSVWGYYFGSALLGFHCVFLCVNIGAYLINLICSISPPYQLATPVESHPGKIQGPVTSE